MAKRVSGESKEMQELSARICRDYLHGAWKQVTAQTIGFKHISGGLSNLLYHISLPKDAAAMADEPEEVLVRVYGQTHGEHALEALITESVVFTLLSERGLGPKLHGIFPGGRIEQYIDARPLRTTELADRELSARIATKMAAIHNMEVPLHKEPAWLWQTIERWLVTCDNVGPSDMPAYFGKLIKSPADLRSEMAWLRRVLESLDSPVVFCHNDMQEGNILVKRDGCEKNNNNNNNNEGETLEDKEIMVIDFEYCSYNYRAFDIANHFVEWVYDYTAEEHPFFSEQPERYPTREQRVGFVRAYLEERRRGGDEGSSEDTVDEVLAEVEVFTLASHFFWGMWGIVNAGTSKIPFGYWEYSFSRLRHYFDLKRRLLDEDYRLGDKRKISEGFRSLSLTPKRKICDVE